MKRIIIFSFFSILAFSLSAQQASIVSVLPGQAFAGSTVNILVRGSNTHVRQGQTTMKISNGNNSLAITPTINVQDQRTLSASVTIPPKTVAADYIITITSGVEPVTGMFSILQSLQPTDPMTALMDVVPVQSITVADFDPNNIKKSPILFVVSVFNGFPHTYINAHLRVYGATYGTIITSDKRIAGSEFKSGTPYRFTNRDFDKVNISQTNKDFFNNALSTGQLPPDDYTYAITLTDEKGNVITVDGTNTISNPASGLQLISPGAPMSSDPELIFNKYPQFQWFSQASKFDIAVYKVNKVKSSPSDVVSQLPIWSQKGLTSTSVLYPNSARLLEDGVTYAWQVTAHIITSKGDKAIPSEVYWFSLGKTNVDFSNISRMEVTPGEVELTANDTVRLKVTAFNTREEVVRVSPEWRVTPPTGGTVTQDGKFTAGSTSGTVAVVAKYGNLQEYSTIKISGAGAAGGAWDFSSFIEKVFGLPKK
jgi:hypothetical protein